MSIFVIAEIGINHNGDIGIAKELIKVAKDAGCDAVKFQKRTIDLVYDKDLLNSSRESPWGKTQRAQKEGLEFGYEQYLEIDKYCKEHSIDWFASAWDIESQIFLGKFNLKYNKIASAMLVHNELLRMIAEENKYTFISTGMSTLEQIDSAVNIFTNKKCPFELMHCVSTYPMDDEDANLNCIKTLKERYQCNVGYSGHEVGLAVSYAATALGITSLERHITLDRAMYGSDQAASLEPAGLRLLVGAVRKIEQALGDGVIGVHPKEVSISKKLRSHIAFNSKRYSCEYTNGASQKNKT
ncbi:MAG: N-acetylneuraminate synthase family protein [Oligoflexia bacterium]|nr:N-acetylneuraminate synthase family protein [Oligoflexia bacterium]